MRELLAEMLRAHGAARTVALVASLEAAAELAPRARLLVCDAPGFSRESVAQFTMRMRAERPGLRVVTIDEPLEEWGIDEIVRAVKPEPGATGCAHETLTPSESEVMLAVAAGLRTSDIARRMRRSSKTVEKHRANVFRKLGIRNVAHLTAYAIQYRLLDSHSILTRQGV